MIVKDLSFIFLHLLFFLVSFVFLDLHVLDNEETTSMVHFICGSRNENGGESQYCTEKRNHNILQKRGIASSL